MILDNEMMFADAQVFGTAAGAELDLGVSRPGPGRPIKYFLQIDAIMTGCTGFTLTTGAVSGSLSALVTVAHTTLEGKVTEFEMPSEVLQFVKLTLTGTLAGTGSTWSAGIVLPGVQTNL